MFARLRTRCGCERVVQVDDFQPFIRVALYDPMPILNLDRQVSPTESQAVSCRDFEFSHRIGHESAEYREVCPRPPDPFPRRAKVGWKPTKHPLMDLDEELRRS